jgi:Secretion system C-terminal sorting domain
MSASAACASAATITVTGPITANTSWTNNNTYILSGPVYVKNAATLTVQPGTLIVGQFSTQGSLVIERDARIIADGTPAQPIVFTSEQLPGFRNRGDWGGLIVLGRAPLNVPGGEAVIEGGLPASEVTYGGGVSPNPNDDSGIIRYVRIEYAGIPFLPNNEINSLTCGAVGAGTIIDYVQVSYANDDAFEFFGGTVDAKHLVALATLDDDFDTDLGYSGRIQFGVSLSDPNAADISGRNSFESDNDASGSGNTPITNPRFSNMTIVGPAPTTTSSFNANYRRGLHTRRNTRMDLYNSILMGWPTGWLLDGSAAEGNANSGELNYENNIMAGSVTANYTVNVGSTFDPNNFVNVTEPGNTTLATCADVQLTNAFNLTGPDFRPLPGSPAETGASFSSLDPFFEVTSYRGAFGTTDWTDCWTNFNPQGTSYPFSTPINGAPTVSISNSGSTSYCDSLLLTSSTSAVISFQWQLNGNNIAGATASTYYAKSTGAYTLLVTNAAGCTAVSNVRNLTKKANPAVPVVRASCNNLGQTVFSITGTYSSFQWRRNGFVVAGATQRSIVPTLPGNYTVTVTGTNGCSSQSATRSFPVTPLATTQLVPARCNKYNLPATGSQAGVAATTVAGTSRYIFNFYEDSSSTLYAQRIQTSSQLGWGGITPALVAGEIYDVTVQRVVNGDTSCVGTLCEIRIAPLGFRTDEDMIEGELKSALDSEVETLQVFPNPTVGNSTVNLSFTTVEGDAVLVDVYDMNGRFVVKAVDQTFSTGTNAVQFNTQELARGTYMLRMAVNGTLQSFVRLTVM